MQANVRIFTVPYYMEQRIDGYLNKLPRTNVLGAMPAVEESIRQFENASVPNYVQISNNQMKLPAYNHRTQILDAIRNHQVVMVGGETGSGKTTQVGQYILNESAQSNIATRILCTQPRRLATTSVAKQVAKQRQTELGRGVGYQIKNDKCVSGESNLIFMTR